MSAMRGRFLIVFLAFAPILRAETVLVAPETGVERDDTTSAEENEAHGIIPVGGLTVSTKPVTPISFVIDKKQYDQALEELALAQMLWSKGKSEAASDVALQAYDDLMNLRLPRRDRKKSQQMRLERRRAATVYIDSSIAYIKDFVKKRGSGESAYKEGRLRLGDLRDVALNYPELMKKLNQTMEAFASQTTSPVVSIPPAEVSPSSSTVSSTTAVTPK